MLSFLLLASLAVAAPAPATGETYAGVATSDVYPPPSATINTVPFPNESQLGFPGITVTGVEAFAAETAPAVASHTNIYPLVVPAPYDTAVGPVATAAVGGNTSATYGNSNNPTKLASTFLSARYWGNLSPQYSVDSSVYGLPGAGPRVPDACSVTQVHYYYRHGARYPTTGAPPQAFATRLSLLAGKFNVTGPLTFLATWRYKLGAELLTPFGRAQNFDLGVAARVSYGHLLTNFTRANKIPVLRTQSQDRMVKTALNFAAGFFGIPAEGQYQLEIIAETPGNNVTGAPYETCTNTNNARGSVGSTASTAYLATALAPAVTRFNSFSTGVNFTNTDVTGMINLCAYETDALGYSKFCELFTEAEFRAFEFGFDLAFYGNNGFGSPVGAAAGLGYLEEFVSRLTQTTITKYDSTTNRTLDNNNVTFPLDQSLYFDAAHEVSILDAITALNLTGIDTIKMTNDSTKPHSFVASQVVPFGTVLASQIVECQHLTPTKQIRFLINDAVIPLNGSYAGCYYEADGFCAFDTVVKALQQRIKDIDFNYACFGNWTVPVGIHDLNGLPPKA